MRNLCLVVLSSLAAVSSVAATATLPTTLSTTHRPSSPSCCFLRPSLPSLPSTSSSSMRPRRRTSSRSSSSSLIMRLNNADGDESPSIFERAFSATPYLLPILDSVNYSKFLAFYAPEFFNPIYAALDPLLAVYKASPFVNLAIYLLIVWVGRQPTLSRFVRFNFQQAIILDVALVIPSILTSVLRDNAAPVWVQEPVANTLFFILSASLLYVSAKLALGEKPNEIPLISQAAEMTAGPF